MANNFDHSHLQDDINDCQSLEGLQILVVDDNEDSLFLTTVILESYGMQVTTAKSASLALEALKNLKFDILIVDIAMPEVDGYSLIREARRMLLLQKLHPPAIALTALCSEDSYSTALLSGFQSYVNKPIDPSILIEEITKVVRFYRWEYDE